MNIVLGNRASGKTTMLIEACHGKPDAVIVCPTRAMCKNAFEAARCKGYDIRMPITFEDFVRGRYDSTTIERFYFDELQSSLDIFARARSRDGSVDTVIIDITEYNSITILNERTS